MVVGDERFGGAVDEGDIGAVRFGFLPGDIEITLRQIDPDDLRVWKFLGDGEAEDAGAAGEIEDLSRGRRDFERIFSSRADRSRRSSD